MTGVFASGLPEDNPSGSPAATNPASRTSLMVRIVPPVRLLDLEQIMNGNGRTGSARSSLSVLIPSQLSI